MPREYGCTTKKSQPHYKCKNAPRCESVSRRIQRLWLRGFVDARTTDGHAKIAGYLAKYMFKAMHDVRLGGEQAYTATRNILRPLSFQVGEVATEDILDPTSEDDVKLISGDNTPLQERSYSTSYLGTCHYQSYKKNK